MGPNLLLTCCTLFSTSFVVSVLTLLCPTSKCEFADACRCSPPNPVVVVVPKRTELDRVNTLRWAAAAVGAISPVATFVRVAPPTVVVVVVFFQWVSTRALVARNAF